ncbi:MAG: hemerythrin domain-containing protein [Dehalococcoidia bacterium]|nr:hemerythrin domain-containing protein [Dehalococcoidia bacterium]
MPAGTDAIKLLKDDHNKVKDLFAEFEKADGRSKKRIAKETILELEVHAKLEEEIFYPKFLETVKDEMITAEAEEEHHVAETVMDELKQMLQSSGTDVHFDAKYMVLAENVKHHIQEEEKEMLPKAEKKMGKEMLADLGEQMVQRKEQLMKEMSAAMA